MGKGTHKGTPTAELPGKRRDRAASYFATLSGLLLPQLRPNLLGLSRKGRILAIDPGYNTGVFLLDYDSGEDGKLRLSFPTPHGDFMSRPSSNPNTVKALDDTAVHWFPRIRPVYAHVARIAHMDQPTIFVVEDYEVRPPYRFSDATCARVTGYLVGMVTSSHYSCGTPLLMIRSSIWKKAVPMVDKQLSHPRFAGETEHALDAVKMALLVARVIHKELMNERRKKQRGAVGGPAGKVG